MVRDMHNRLRDLHAMHWQMTPGPSQAFTSACSCCAAEGALQDRPWTFLMSGAIPFACEAVAAAPDAHQKLHAVALLTTSLQRMKECLEVRSLSVPVIQACMQFPALQAYPLQAHLSVC